MSQTPDSDPNPDSDHDDEGVIPIFAIPLGALLEGAFPVSSLNAAARSGELSLEIACYKWQDPDPVVPAWQEAFAHAAGAFARVTVMNVPERDDLVAVDVAHLIEYSAKAVCPLCGQLRPEDEYGPQRGPCAAPAPAERPGCALTARMLPYGMATLPREGIQRVLEIGGQGNRGQFLHEGKPINEREVFVRRPPVSPLAVGARVWAHHPKFGRLQGRLLGWLPGSGLADVDISEDPVTLAAIGMQQRDRGLAPWTEAEPIFPRLWLNPATVRAEAAVA